MGLEKTAEIKVQILTVSVGDHDSERLEGGITVADLRIEATPGGKITRENLYPLLREFEVKLREAYS